MRKDHETIKDKIYLAAQTKYAEPETRSDFSAWYNYRKTRTGIL